MTARDTRDNPPTRTPWTALWLAILLLGAQWLLLGHELDHLAQGPDEGTVCEICLAAGGLGHAVLASGVPPVLPGPAGFVVSLPPDALGAGGAPAAYRVRAPPLHS